MKGSRLDHILYRFFKKNLNSEKPVIIALSGGPDSLCLFSLLVKYRERNPLNIHIAHIDHAWREESQEEARQLQDLAEKLQIPFHCRRLGKLIGNLELKSREERLLFYSEIVLKHDCQAVLLGHHADDQAETILKRIFEASNLTQLTGMEEVSFYPGVFGGFTIWRPLLGVSKSDLENYLKDHALQGFQDSTNLDTRFLRARLRSLLLPQLAEQFGKEINNSLCRLGKEAQELKNYFDQKLSHILDVRIEAPFGSLYNLSNHLPSSLVEIKYLIKLLGQNEKVTFSFSQVECIAEFLQNNSAGKVIDIFLIKVFIDRKRMFFVHKEINLLNRALDDF